jgi:hypothetical protein
MAIKLDPVALRCKATRPRTGLELIHTCPKNEWHTDNVNNHIDLVIVMGPIQYKLMLEVE